MEIDALMSSIKIVDIQNAKYMDAIERLCRDDDCDCVSYTKTFTALSPTSSRQEYRHDLRRQEGDLVKVESKSEELSFEYAFGDYDTEEYATYDSGRHFPILSIIFQPSFVLFKDIKTVPFDFTLRYFVVKTSLRMQLIQAWDPC
jgi:hypothetical protein